MYRDRVCKVLESVVDLDGTPVGDPMKALKVYNYIVELEDSMSLVETLTT